MKVQRGSRVSQLIAVGAVLLVASACKQEAGPPPPEPQAVVPSGLRSDAGARPDGPKGLPVAESAADTAKPMPAGLWSYPKRNIDKDFSKNSVLSSKGVLVAVDVAGAKKGMDRPVSFFLKLCGDRYNCSVEAIQAPGSEGLKVAGGAGAASQRDSVLMLQWMERTKKAREKTDTPVPEWTSAWLYNAAAPDVAIIWYDGMTDNANANAVVENTELAKLSGAWALTGTLKTGEGESPLMLYVLAREGKVDEGAKVAYDLTQAAGGAGYFVKFDQVNAVELYPGTGWAGQLAVTRTTGTAEPFKAATGRDVTVEGADGAKSPLASGGSASTDLPATLRVKSASQNEKSLALESFATQWQVKGGQGIAVPGVDFVLKLSGQLPAAVSNDAFRILPDWRWETLIREGDKTQNWGLGGTNSNADFRGRTALVVPCAGEIDTARFSIGVHDFLACKNPSDGLVGASCGQADAGSLVQLFAHPDVKPFLGAPSTARCAPHLLVVQTAKDRVPYAPIASDMALTIDAEVGLSNKCAEAVLAFDVDAKGLSDEVARRLSACDTPLLQQFKQAADNSESSAGVFGRETLTIGPDKKRVTKLYGWHLLHKFAIALGKRAVDDFAKHGVPAGDRTRVPLVRVVVEPAPKYAN